MPEIYLYTVEQLRNWLNGGNEAECLYSKIIAPARAWSIVNNPYVENDDTVLAAIFDNGQAIAFTAAFPEKIDEKRIWWLTTLYCSENNRGQGLGLIVVGSLTEKLGIHNCFDRWGVIETVQILQYLGHKTHYSTRFIHSNKSIDNSTFKGKGAFVLQCISKTFHQLKSQKLPECKYVLDYINHIDENTYNFIKSHQNTDLFLHSREMLNWELQYPVMQSCPIDDKVMTDNPFSSYCTDYRSFAVKVVRNEVIVGFFMLRLTDKKLKVVYLYYNTKDESFVFNAIVRHICKFSCSSFETENKKLSDFVAKYVYFPKIITEQISFSYPNDSTYAMATLDKYTFQLGDGDSFI